MNRKSFRTNFPGGSHLQKPGHNGFCIVIDVNSFLQDLLVQTGLGPITYVTLLYMRTSSNCTYNLQVVKYVRQESYYSKNPSAPNRSTHQWISVCVNGHGQFSSFSITFPVLRMLTIARLLWKHLGLNSFSTAIVTR